jgi:hypothetical protein
MKKLTQQKDATELAISVLCDLTKQYCSMCEWEQERSDNPLLFNPFLLDATLQKEKIGSSTNNPCAQSANCN